MPFLIRYLAAGVLWLSFVALLIQTFVCTALAQIKEADSVFALAQSHYLKGNSFLQMGDKSQALRQFDKAAEFFADHQDYLRSKSDSIKSIYESFTVKEPQSPLFTYLMGRWYAAARRDSVGQNKAKEYYETALRLEPRFVRSYHGLGSLSTRKGDYNAAERHYINALEIDSSFGIGYTYLADTYDRMGKQDLGLKVRRDLLRRDSTSYAATFAMLYIARASNGLSEKEEMYRKAIRLSELTWLRDGAYMELMRALVGEQPDSAESLARRILSENLSSDIYTRQTAQLTIFYAYQKTGRDRITAYANSLLGEKDPLLLGQIGAFCLDSLNDPPMALRCLKAAYDVCTKDHVHGTVIHGTGISEERLVQVALDLRHGFLASKLGQAYFQLKEYDNSETYLREAADYGLKKSNSFALYRLGYTLKAKGNKEEAIKWLTRGLAMKHDDKAMAALEELLGDSAGKQVAAEKISAERRKSAKEAPNFTLATLRGDSVRLSDLRGRIVMIDFWATWCGPCISELPNLVKLYAKYSKNPNVVFLSIDTNEPAAAIEPFMQKNGYSFTVLLGNQSSVPQQYGVEGIPTKFLIDRDGKIQFKHIGGGADAKVIDELTKELEELLVGN